MTSFPMTASEGSLALRARIQSFLEHPRDMGIKAPCGLGKTSCFVSELQACHFRFDGDIEIYVPTHNLAEQVADSLRYTDTPKGPRLRNGRYHSGISVQVIRGRGQTTKFGQPMCRRKRTAGLLSKKGRSVYHNLCASDDGDSRCPHYATCPYIRQYNSDVVVRIYTHASLPLRRGLLDKEIPSFAMIDESFYSSFLKHHQINLSELATLNEYGRLGSVLQAALVQGIPLLEHLRSVYCWELDDVINDAIQGQYIEDAVIDPEMAVKKQMRAIRSLPGRSYLVPLLQAIKAELPSGRGPAHSVEYRDGQIYLHYREGLHRFMDSGRSVPVLAIDADWDERIHRVFFPGAEIHSISVERNCHVTQVYSTRNSKYSLTQDRDSKKRIRDIQNLINRLVAHGPILVVGPQSIVGNPNKGVEPQIHVPDSSALAHFGSIRGIDDFKDFDTIVLIGRNQPPLTALESDARALWFDSTRQLQFGDDWLMQECGYRMREGTAVGVNVPVHPDSRVQSLLEQIRESESIQAIDRLRLIHCERQKRVIILSNTVLDITVDQLVSWSDLMSGGVSLAQAWERLDGVMPLNAAFLQASFPDLFPTIAGARYALRKNRVQKCAIPNIYSIRDYALLAAYTYRVSGQRGRNSTCISEFDENTTRAELEGLLGDDVTIVNQVAERDRHDPRPQTSDGVETIVNEPRVETEYIPEQPTPP